VTSTSSTPARESFAGRLGWRTERRPDLGFAHVLGAGAGAFVVFAAQALVVEITSEDATLAGVLINLAVLAAAFAVGALTSGPVRSAAVSAAVLTVPVLFFWAFLGDGEGGRGSFRLVFLLSLAVYLVLYALVWTRGRTVVLALALVFFGAWFILEFGTSPADPFPFSERINADTPFGLPRPDTSFDADDATDPDAGLDTDALEEALGGQQDESTASLVVGLGYLFAGFALDRRGRTGAATPFIALGSFFSIFAAATLGADESVQMAGLAAAGTGALVGLIGGFGPERRATTWIGVLAVVAGLVVAIADLADSALGFAGLAALVAIVLGLVAAVLAPRLQEDVDGDTGASEAR
jgi:MFS family permease